MSDTSRGRKDQTNCEGDESEKGQGKREEEAKQERAKRVFALTKLSANEKQEKDMTRRKRCPKKRKKKRTESVGQARRKDGRGAGSRKGGRSEDRSG